MTLIVAFNIVAALAAIACVVVAFVRRSPVIGAVGLLLLAVEQCLVVPLGFIHSETFISLLDILGTLIGIAGLALLFAGLGFFGARRPTSAPGTPPGPYGPPGAYPPQPPGGHPPPPPPGPYAPQPPAAPGQGYGVPGPPPEQPYGRPAPPPRRDVPEGPGYGMPPYGTEGPPPPPG